MALYLVIHSPRPDSANAVRPPTRLRELAEDSRGSERSPRWLKSWSPDMGDDRLFTLWDAKSADEIQATLAEFGFLDDMEAAPIRVREWGPEDVLAAD